MHMLFVKRCAAILACSFFAGVAGMSTAKADDLVVYKLGVNATGANAVSNPSFAWTTPGNFGSNPSLTDSTTDYRSSFADTNWSEVTSVNVGMYDSSGNEVAYFTFEGPAGGGGVGETIANFYSTTYLTGSNYTDLSSFSGNFFSYSGDQTNGRGWFVNQNYGGCGSDTGWFDVDFGSKPCSWETTRDNATSGRGFLYTLNNNQQNWNTSNVGSADVFAITVTFPGNSSVTPEPSTLVTLGTGLAGLAGFIRRRRV